MVYIQNVLRKRFKVLDHEQDEDCHTIHKYDHSVVLRDDVFLRVNDCTYRFFNYVRTFFDYILLKALFSGLLFSFKMININKSLKA